MARSQSLNAASARVASTPPTKGPTLTRGRFKLYLYAEESLVLARSSSYPTANRVQHEPFPFLPSHPFSHNLFNLPACPLLHYYLFPLGRLFHYSPLSHLISSAVHSCWHKSAGAPPKYQFIIPLGDLYPCSPWSYCKL